MIPLPTLPPPTGPRNLSPTDVTGYLRAGQCDAYLWHRVAEQNKAKILEANHLRAQRTPPLMSLSGDRFEESVGRQLRRHFPHRVFGGGPTRRPDNADLAAEARHLRPGAVKLLFQTRLHVEIGDWKLRGDADLIRLERTPENILQILIVDLKSSVHARVEHRLQVAFYRLMVEAALAEGRVRHEPPQLAVLFKPPVDPSPEEAAEAKPLQDAAAHWFQLAGGERLEVVADPDAYVAAVGDLVLAPDAAARRVIATPYDQLSFAFSQACDGCLYTEFCMKWAAERDDLALLPYLNRTDKAAFARAGVTSARQLAELKDLDPGERGPGGRPPVLSPAAGKEALVRQLAATWPVGPRLDEWVHRARMYCKSARQLPVEAVPFLPGRGHSTLPAATAELHPNLVRVFLDGFVDPLEGRFGMLAARVVACDKGEAVARRDVIRRTPKPPDSPVLERELFTRWTRDLLAAVVELARSGAPAGEPKTAPVHLIFWCGADQTRLLEGLARNFGPVAESAPPLYDFLTQLAAFDSPVCTFLDDEVRASKNLATVCPSLISVSNRLGFQGWKQGQPPLKDQFKARVFDHVSKLDRNGVEEWYTRRARFGSTIPAEYAYAAWGALPPPKGHDDFADFRGVDGPALERFQAARLAALEDVASKLPANADTEKTPFRLPDLARFTDASLDLAHALGEFLHIERMVSLGEWKAARRAPAGRRVLAGDALIVRYDEADQLPGVAAKNRDAAERASQHEAIRAKNAADGNAGKKRTKAEMEATRWSHAGTVYRLRLDVSECECDLQTALLLTKLRDGASVILSPRWMVDTRLPEAERKPLEPSPKWMLYSQRGTLLRVAVTARDAAGRATEAFAEVELRESGNAPPFAFGGRNEPLSPGAVYTLDECPDDWTPSFANKVVDGLTAGQPHALFARLASGEVAPAPAGLPGQARFLAGLDAFRVAGHLHDFEPAKREFIGGHGAAPLLVVQGPPGTGKSYSTAFAVLARIQAAMDAGRECRALLSCKTHAAVDVLVGTVTGALAKLRELRAADAALFARHFDARLLELPVFRLSPKQPPPAGVTPLPKDAEREEGADRAADVISGESWCVVAATPGGAYRMVKDRWTTKLFGHELFGLLVLDEASQMGIPEALLASLALASDAPAVVVGDHRQMPPIVRHDWDGEARRTFAKYPVYRSLFDTLLALNAPVVRFAESFRLHAAAAEFLRKEVYQLDGIAYHSKKRKSLPAVPGLDPLTAAALHPEYPLAVVLHGEGGSQLRNDFERDLIGPILTALADPASFGLDAEEGYGVVVPHRAQRAALLEAYPSLAAGGRPAADTVERYQGGERRAILVSATESDPGYLLQSSGFLLDPRRLTVAVSRAKEKVIVAASRNVFSLVSPDEETFANAKLWKNLLAACPEVLWAGEVAGVPVEVRGGRLAGPAGGG